MNKPALRTVAVVASIVASSASSAETQRYDCLFPKFISGSLGMIKVAPGLGFSIEWEIGSDQASLSGNMGFPISTVLVVSGFDGTTFLEIFGSGAVQTTTIDRNGGAVHSRHTIIDGEVMPRHYYGTCERS